MATFIVSIFMRIQQLFQVAFRHVRRYSTSGILSQVRRFHTPETAMRRKVRQQIREIVTKLENEEFAGIRAQFPLFLKIILPETVLRKGWKMLQQMAGPVVSTGTPDISVGWFLNTARVPIQFKRMKMTMALKTTKSGTVVGLRFLPANLAALGLGGATSVWRQPEYDLPELYEQINVTLGNRRNAVGGTLTLPRNAHKSPCIILLGGSGPCDRDSTVQAAKPFKDIACGLAKEGIAVLRFDKVTFTHGRKLANKSDFTLTDEYWEHATAAIQTASQHPKISKSNIFLAGHSLGAVVCPKLSTSSASVAGMILMAAPAMPLYWCAIRQLEYLSQLESTVDDDKEDVGLRDLRKAAILADSSDLSKSTPAEELPFGIGPSYWLDYRTFQPIATTQAINKPVLVLQGEQDYQVTMEDDYVHWETALQGMDNVELRSYKGLNHLFMQCTGPSKPTDYENACNVEACVIQDIAHWIQVNHNGDDD